MDKKSQRRVTQQIQKYTAYFILDLFIDEFNS
jgi:hypothetical protein